MCARHQHGPKGAQLYHTSQDGHGHIMVDFIYQYIYVYIYKYIYISILCHMIVVTCTMISTKTQAKLISSCTRDPR